MFAHVAGAGVSVPEGIVVVGMHRSGTSAATRLVNMLGPALCSDLTEELSGNPTGHWESLSLIGVNDRLLSEMGRSWWCPPPAGTGFAAADARILTPPDEAAANFDAVHPNRPWVYKDPRLCLTLPFWRRALDRALAVVFVYRNPIEVAKSLCARNDFSLHRGIATWERYNRLALANCGGLPTHVETYDDMVADPVGWCERVFAFLESCGLPATMPAVSTIESFVVPQLRHSEHDRAEIAARFETVLPVLDALESRVGSWPSFDAPPLPPEPSWVEAEFVYIGSTGAASATTPAAPSPRGGRGDAISLLL